MFPVGPPKADEIARPQRSAAATTALLCILLALGGCSRDTAEGPADASPPKLADVETILWEEGVKNAYPRWSLDGSHILFQSDRSGTWQIYLMEADGSKLVALTAGEVNNNFPSWSPDGSAIAFVSDRDGNEDVYVMNAAGEDLRNLSNNPARDIHPYWSPDGRKILFNSDREDDLLQIWEVNVDGSGLRRLVASGDHNTCARVSPDGERIVYLANLAVGQDDVLMSSRDGSGVVNLTSDEMPDGWPTWMPDGGRIVYASQRPGRFSLFSMRVDGTDRRQITAPDEPFVDARPDISGDGRRIVFNRQDENTIGIFVVELDAGAP